MALVLLVAGFVAVDSQWGTAPAQAAPKGSAYDHGLIITDSTFRDYGSMTVSQIQAFFKSKVSSCPNAPSSRKCLTEYVGSTQPKGASALGCTKAMPSKTNISAAQMVYDVAQACQINPKVLIVLMQKEQGLVTTVNPSDWQIKQATGWGCPDDGACQKNNGGLFHSLYAAAWQYNQYFKNTSYFNWIPIGTATKIKEHPKSGTSNNPNKCTTKSITVKNRATAALYYYTPYYPNTAALNNLYGEGNKCSSYGNRNFWVYYHDWFGSTQTGSHLVKASSGPTYLIKDSTIYPLDTSLPELASAYAPLGKVGTVSSQYLSGFTRGPTLGRLVRNSNTGLYFVVDKGQRYRLADCAAVEARGFSCKNVPEPTMDQLALLPYVGHFEPLVQHPDGTRYALTDGKRRQVLDDASAELAGLDLSKVTPLTSAAIASVPLAAPIVRPGVTFTPKNNGTQYVTGADSTLYNISATEGATLSLSKWFPAAPKSLTDASLALLTQQALPTRFQYAGEHFLLSERGKHKSPSTAKSGDATLPTVLFDAIPEATEFSRPHFIRSGTATQLWLLQDGVRQKVANSAERGRMAADLGVPVTTVNLSPSAFNSIPSGLDTVASGTRIKLSTSTAVWLVDGGERFRVSSAQAKELGLTEKPRVVSKAVLEQFPIRTQAPLGMQCGGQFFLTIKGKRFAVSESVADQFRPVFGFREYSPGMCARVPVSTAATGTVIKHGSTYYVVHGGKKYKISSNVYNAYKALDGITARTVNKAMAAMLPTKSAPVLEGDVLKLKNSGTKWLITAEGRVKVSTAQRKDLGFTAATRTVSASTLAKYPVIAGSPLGAQCEDQFYLTSGGTWIPIAAETVDQYRPAIGFPVHSEFTCAMRPKATKGAGQLLVVGSKYYAVDGGAKRTLTKAQYQSLSAELGVKAATVSATFVAALPTAK